MAVAFVGVGLSELFQRRRLSVLAGPLHNTGIFLPLVPLLVFWVQPPGVIKDYLENRIPDAQPLWKALDAMPNAQSAESWFDNYALLWLLSGGLCVLVAVARHPAGTLCWRRWRPTSACGVCCIITAGSFWLILRYGWCPWL